MNRMGHKKDRNVGVKTQQWDWNQTQSKSMVYEQNTQDLQDTMKSQNLLIISIEEGISCQINILNKIIEDNPPNLEKDAHPDIKGSLDTNQIGPERKSPCQI